MGLRMFSGIYPRHSEKIKLVFHFLLACGYRPKSGIYPRHSEKIKLVFHFLLACGYKTTVRVISFLVLQ